MIVLFIKDIDILIENNLIKKIGKNIEKYQKYDIINLRVIKRRRVCKFQDLLL